MAAIGVISAIVWALDRLRRKTEKPVDRWGREWLIEGGHASPLLLAGGALLLLGLIAGVLGVSNTAWVVGVGAAVFGGGVLKLYDEIGTLEQHRQVLRRDLYQAYFLDAGAGSADASTRAELAAQIVSGAIASPLRVYAGLPERLGDQVASGSCNRQLFHSCIGLLESDQDDQWAHMHRWVYRLEFPKPTKTVAAFDALRDAVATKLPPEVAENSTGEGDCPGAPPTRD